MESQNTIDVLNKLIIINNDRIEGYETASKETGEQDLKTLFAQFGATSQKCRAELVAEVTKLGGTPEEGTLLSGKFFRAWMEVKAALTGKDRKLILNSCEDGEDAAKDTYTDVLTDDLKDLTSPLQVMIKQQQALLMADHNSVKVMRDALVTT